MLGYRTGLSSANGLGLMLVSYYIFENALDVLAQRWATVVSSAGSSGERAPLTHPSLFLDRAFTTRVYGTFKRRYDRNSSRPVVSRSSSPSEGSVEFGSFLHLP